MIMEQESFLRVGIHSLNIKDNVVVSMYNALRSGGVNFVYECESCSS